MNLPIEVLSHICSFGHPYEFRSYNQIDKFCYKQAEQIKYVFIQDMPNKEYLRTSLHLKYSDIIKLSLLYDPIEESKGKYDIIYLYYYCLLKGKNPSFLQLIVGEDREAIVAILKWKFRIEDENKWRKLLDNENFELVRHIVKDVLIKNNIFHNNNELQGIIRSIETMFLPIFEDLLITYMGEINKFAAIIATCNFLSLEDRLRLISNLEKYNKVELYVYNGIIGNQNYKYKSLYTIGAYLTYQYNESLKTNATLPSISSIIGSNIYQVHDFESITESVEYYKATGEYHKYYEWKRIYRID